MAIAPEIFSKISSPVVATIKYRVYKTQKTKSAKFILNFAQDQNIAQEAIQENKDSKFLELRQKWAVPTENPVLDCHKDTKKFYVRVLPVDRKFLTHFLIAVESILEVEFNQ